VRHMSAVGVVLAGGSGTRMGAEVPKQLLDLGGRPILMHSVAAFDAAPEIDEILVVVVAAYLDRVRELCAASGVASRIRVIAGGHTRTDSTRLALEELAGLDAERVVLVHDAARPLVSPALIGRCVQALAAARAVTAAVPSTDTIATVAGGIVTGIGDRALLRRVQTPQGFRLGTLRRAYALAGADPGFVATDDTSVVLRYLPEVAVHLKVTTPIDLALAETLLRAR
jgi:2-C-methyl-D-erythritol 4-phosphate cytidylyltransferase